MTEERTLTADDAKAIGQRLALYVAALGLPEDQENELARHIMELSPAEGLFVLENIEDLIAQKMTGEDDGDFGKKIKAVMEERAKDVAKIDADTAAAIDALAAEYQVQ